MSEDSKLRQEIADNMMLQKCIKIISNIPLYDVDENNEVIDKDYDYSSLLEEYKSNYRNGDLRFEVSDESSINNILYQFGGINISNNNGNLVYILQIK